MIHRSKRNVYNYKTSSSFCKWAEVTSEKGSIHLNRKTHKIMQIEKFRSSRSL